MTTLVSGKWTIQVALAFPFSFGWLFQRLSKCHLAKTFESSSSRFVRTMYCYYNMDGWWTLAGIKMRMLVVHLFYYDVSSWHLLAYAIINLLISFLISTVVVLRGRKWSRPFACRSRWCFCHLRPRAWVFMGAKNLEAEKLLLHKLLFLCSSLASFFHLLTFFVGNTASRKQLWKRILSLCLLSAIYLRPLKSWGKIHTCKKPSRKRKL